MIRIRTLARKGLAILLACATALSTVPSVRGAPLSGDLTVVVHSIPGSNLPDAGGTFKVDIWEGDYEHYVGHQVGAFSGGESSRSFTFYGLNAGDHTIEVYQTPDAGLGIEEFWGADGGVTVLEGQTSYYDFYHHTPVCWDFEPQDGQYAPGDSIAPSVTAKNFESYAKGAKVRLIIDKDKRAPYDYDVTSSAYTISSNSTHTFYLPSLSFVDEGDYYAYAIVLGQYGPSSEYIETDQWTWTRAFTVVAPAGDLGIAVHNIPGYALPGAGGTISVDAWKGDYGEYTGRKSVSFSGGESSKSVTFYDLDPADYTIEVYQTPDAGLGIEEFWGADDGVTVSEGQTNDHSFDKHVPVCWDFEPQDGQYAPGDSIAPSVTAKNFETYAKGTKVRLIIDRDRTAPYDYDETSAAYTISSDSTHTFYLPSFSVIDEGDYYAYAIVLGQYGPSSEYIETDQWTWTRAFSAISPVGDLRVDVHNIPGYPLPEAGGTISVDAWEGDYGEYAGRKSVSFSGGESSKSVTFYDLDPADYTIEVYQTPDAGLGIEEFWGADDGVTVLEGQTNDHSLDKHVPVCWDIQPQGQEYSPGDAITPTVTVENFEYYEKETKVKLIVDRDQSEPYDYVEMSAAHAIPANETHVFQLPSFAPTEEGDYYAYSIVLGQYGVTSDYVETDQWTWTRAITADPLKGLRDKEEELLESAIGSEGGNGLIQAYADRVVFAYVHSREKFSENWLDKVISIADLISGLIPFSELFPDLTKHAAELAIKGAAELIKTLKECADETIAFNQAAQGLREGISDEVSLRDAEFLSKIEQRHNQFLDYVNSMSPEHKEQAGEIAEKCIDRIESTRQRYINAYELSGQVADESIEPTPIMIGNKPIHRTLYHTDAYWDLMRSLTGEAFWWKVRTAGSSFAITAATIGLATGPGAPIVSTVGFLCGAAYGTFTWFLGEWKNAEDREMVLAMMTAMVLDASADFEDIYATYDSTLDYVEKSLAELETPEAEITSFTAQDVKVGEEGTFNIDFRNNGRTEVKASGVIRILSDSEPIGLVETLTRTVGSGDTVALEATYTLAEPGTYTARAAVVYEGQETAETSISFEIDSHDLELRTLRLDRDSASPGETIRIDASAYNHGRHVEDVSADISITGPDYSFSESASVGIVDPDHATPIEQLYTWHAPADLADGYYEIEVTIHSLSEDERPGNNTKITSVYISPDDPQSFGAYVYEWREMPWNDIADYTTYGAPVIGAYGPISYHNNYNGHTYTIAIPVVEGGNCNRSTPPEEAEYWIFILRDDGAIIWTPAWPDREGRRQYYEYFDNNLLLIGVELVASDVIYVKVGNPTSDATLSPSYQQGNVGEALTYQVSIPAKTYSYDPKVLSTTSADPPEIIRDTELGWFTVDPASPQDDFQVTATPPAGGLFHFAVDTDGPVAVQGDYVASYIVFGQLEVVGGDFTGSDFSCSCIPGGHNCSLSYTNNLGENAQVMFLYADSDTGLVVSAPVVQAIEGSGSVSSSFFCFSVDPGTYRVSWRAFRESDTDLSDAVAWSTSDESQYVQCPACPPDLSVFDPEIDGCTVTINGVVTSPCDDPIHRIHWDWGDDQANDSWFPATHGYSRSGTYEVTVTAHTAGGCTATQVKTLTVSCGTGEANLLLFGGLGASGTYSDTWMLDDADWAEEHWTGPTPFPRGGHTMVYDSNRDRVVLFGGNLSAGRESADMLNDTWEYSNGFWVQVVTDNTPEPRTGHQMAYDSDRGVVVLFGGNYAPHSHCVEDAAYTDTWEYDGANWHEITTAHSPPQFHTGAMVYDEARGSVVLFTGWEECNYGWEHETWEYDGSDWTRITEGALGGIWRYQFAMAYDPARERTVLFGGYHHGGAGCSLNDTWEYDGQGWTRVNTPNAPPGRCNRRMMAYDETRQAIVLFGGNVGGTLADDTWTYDGTDWQQITTILQPAARQRGALVTSGSVCALAEDVNGDGVVDVADIQAVAVRWREPAGPPYDIDGDGIVTVADVMQVAAHWGETCGPTLMVSAASNSAPIGNGANMPLDVGTYEVTLSSGLNLASDNGLYDVDKVLLWTDTPGDPYGWFWLVEEGTTETVVISHPTEDQITMWGFVLDTDTGNNVGSAMVTFTPSAGGSVETLYVYGASDTVVMTDGAHMPLDTGTYDVSVSSSVNLASGNGWYDLDKVVLWTDTPGDPHGWFWIAGGDTTETIVVSHPTEDQLTMWAFVPDTGTADNVGSATVTFTRVP